ncbi:MAG: M13 family peptidase [Candidatus Angelobacter sp. Gp1-AA117]|nr:MAG: M13 family peptidase [Candidatus Angelobacter sp. Gp1-AA117]
MRNFLRSAAMLLLAGMAIGQQNTPSSEPPKQIPSFDLAGLDKTANPCQDFYQYACGGWLKNNPIPSDQPSWGRFNELAEHNRAVLHEILEQAAKPSAGRTANQQKIGDYYASCMNEEAINKKGIAVLKPEFDRINAMKSKAGLVNEMAHLHGIGISALFDFGSGPDFKNAKEVIAQVDQGGLSLPERDYYLKTDEKSVELQKAYVQHVTNMFKLLGDSSEKAAAEAAAVMNVETALAKGSMQVVKRRDPANIYHKMTAKEWEALVPSLSLPKYLTGIGAPAFSDLNVVNPDFFKTLETELNQVSLDDLKTYLRWHLVHGQVHYLPTPFVNEDFDFFGKTLTGAKELRARWKRCVSDVDGDLGEALGQEYVRKVYPPEAKERTLKMVHALEAALHDDINHVDWMTDTTKKQAIIKLNAIQNKIGYPDKWRDYSTLKIVRGDALGNSLRSNTFEFRRQLNKIGKPLDKKEWGMTPPTVNAYYNPLQNDINFPAGILQPPFYDFKADDGLNFGGIGAVIGHELTHGFDDSGRQFDAEGNLKDWWTPEDDKAFEQRAQCLVDEYNGFVAVDDVHLNGKLTLGENTADNGGLRIAHIALEKTLEGKQPEKIDGFTPEQRLFLGWGQIWCDNESDQSARLLALTNPHSLGKFRINGVMQNMPEFAKAWGCKAGQPMVSQNACHVW